ncbi:MAG: YneF family protein [Bacilli bacterium]|nr:YneF family protein [Bacillales bacterium]MDY2574525.1 YneF family protein [Bacilli bacterium]
MMSLNIGLFILYLVLALLAGLVIGFFVTRKIFQKQLEKNPPINEKMIRAMFLQMGRKPSEAQIKQVMKSMNQYK